MNHDPNDVKNGELDQTRLTAYALDQLEGAERAAVEVRLAESDRSRHTVEEIRALAAEVKKAADRQALPPRSPELRVVLEQYLPNEEAAEMNAKPEPSSKKAPRPGRRRSTLIWAAAVCALAAAIPGYVLISGSLRQDLQSVALEQQIAETPASTIAADDVLSRESFEGKESEGEPLMVSVPLGDVPRLEASGAPAEAQIRGLALGKRDQIAADSSGPASGEKMHRAFGRPLSESPSKPATPLKTIKLKKAGEAGEASRVVGQETTTAGIEIGGVVDSQPSNGQTTLSEQHRFVASDPQSQSAPIAPAPIASGQGGMMGSADGPAPDGFYAGSRRGTSQTGEGNAVPMDGVAQSTPPSGQPQVAVGERPYAVPPSTAPESEEIPTDGRPPVATKNPQRRGPSPPPGMRMGSGAYSEDMGMEGSDMDMMGMGMMEDSPDATPGYRPTRAGTTEQLGQSMYESMYGASRGNAPAGPRQPEEAPRSGKPSSVAGQAPVEVEVLQQLDVKILKGKVRDAEIAKLIKEIKENDGDEFGVELGLKDSRLFEERRLHGRRPESIGAGRQYNRLSPNTEQYDPIVENKFLSAADHPESTFSVDVDSASYANVRRFLDSGRLPPPNAVRIEELVNYFRYDYPQPDGEVPFSVNMETAQCPWDTEHRLLRIGLKGREIDPQQRGPSNLVFLLDVSGSMRDENKLPLVQYAMNMLVGQLNEDDRVAIVTYAGNAGVALDSTSGEKRTKIQRAIANLSAGGSTHGSAGIVMAYDQAMQHLVKNGTNRVILCTDGDLNVGVTSDDELVKLITQQAKSGVFLTVLGFGTGNLKDSKMEKLADRGNGIYAYVDGRREARRVLVEQMAGSLVTIAKDVKIQLEFNPAEVESYRLIGYENRIMAAKDFANDKKDAGEIGAGHTVTALYEIVLGGADSGGELGRELKYQRKTGRELTEAATSGELLTLKLRYKEPDGKKSKLLEFVQKDSDKKFGQASADFRFASSVAAFGMLLRGSQYAGDLSWSAAEEFAAGSLGEDPGGYRNEFLELIHRAGELRQR